METAKFHPNLTSRSQEKVSLKFWRVHQKSRFALLPADQTKSKGKQWKALVA